MASLAPTAGGGPASDMVGVAMERANVDEPEVTKYCGPLAKLVSWAESVAMAKDNRSEPQNRERITTSARTDAPEL